MTVTGNNKTFSLKLYTEIQTRAFMDVLTSVFSPDDWVELYRDLNAGSYKEAVTEHEEAKDRMETFYQKKFIPYDLRP
jgi:hypothetical protein